MPLPILLRLNRNRNSEQSHTVRTATYAEAASLSALDYEKQGEIKTKQVRDKLERIAGLESPDVKDMIQMEEPYRYRNKAEMPVRGGCVGFFEAKSHRVCDIPDCIIQSEAAMAAAQAVRVSGEECIRLWW